MTLTLPGYRPCVSLGTRWWKVSFIRRPHSSQLPSRHAKWRGTMPGAMPDDLLAQMDAKVAAAAAAAASRPVAVLDGEGAFAAARSPGLADWRDAEPEVPPTPPSRRHYSKAAHAPAPAPAPVASVEAAQHGTIDSEVDMLGFLGLGAIGAVVSGLFNPPDGPVHGADCDPDSDDQAPPAPASPSTEHSLALYE